MSATIKLAFPMVFTTKDLKSRYWPELRRQLVVNIMACYNEELDRLEILTKKAQLTK